MNTERNYTIYFEIYGKKLKVVVMAKNEADAQRIVRDKIIFHKVEKSKDEFNECIDMLEDFTNLLKK